MQILAVNPGHDGAIAAIADRKLLFSLEGEKDSFHRYQELHVNSVLGLLEHVAEPPDVIALGGWPKGSVAPYGTPIGAGYAGDEIHMRTTRFLGRSVKVFSSSHERSHIAMAIGMAPRNDSRQHVVLVWEGALGHFYLVDDQGAIERRIPVMERPGHRYAFLYGLADPTFPEGTPHPRGEDAGKLMALAAYGDSTEADAAITDAVERILTAPTMSPVPKHDFRDTPLYNAGLEAQETKIAAALLTRRLFEEFAKVATENLPQGLPLYISGGCGLNCDWNHDWRNLGHFSSVFVPPCANDSGSALGTGIDALATLTGDPHIEWSVYSGLEFEWDHPPHATRWQSRNLDMAALAETIGGGEVVAWVQGRWEIGPRALGARSLLAEPFNAKTRERLNEIKQREGFRPIAPCCRLEDADKLFTEGFEDPYMLYFRVVRPESGIDAVTHVDGSARAQTVTHESNAPLHDLLSAFAERYGVGVLCNTSLNFKGLGFINRMSELISYCELRGVREMVVGDTWFSDTKSPFYSDGARAEEVQDPAISVAAPR